MQNEQTTKPEVQKNVASEESTPNQEARKGNKKLTTTANTTTTETKAATPIRINDTTLIKLDDFLSLDATRQDGSEIVEHGYLGMRKQNEEWVNTLAHTDHTQWPKVTVVKKPEGYVLVDGYHRLEAARLIGVYEDKGSDKVPDNGKPEKPIAALPVDILTFDSDIEIVKFAHEANNKHGLPPSATSRTQYGMILLHEMVAKDGTPHFTEAAKKVGISKVTLFKAWNKALKDAEKEAEKPTSEKEAEEALTDEERATKKFATALRTFTKSVVWVDEGEEPLTTEDIAEMLASFLTQEDDKGMITDMVNIMRDTSKIVNKPSKAKKTKKATQPEMFEEGIATA